MIKQPDVVLSADTGEVGPVAIYARVSSDRQARDGTIASQVEALRQRVLADALPLSESMCFIDDGYSGSTLIRPHLERLRDLAATGEIGRLYVLSPDRLARDFVDQMVLVDELRRCGVELLFVNRPLGESPEDQLLLQVQGAMAQYERMKIMERCRRGRLHAARQGKLSVLGQGCYGYRRTGSPGSGVAAWNIVLEEARVIRQVFEWVGRERVSLSQACKRLMKQGVCSPRGHVRWGSTTVWKMLKNPAYKGRAAYGKTRAVDRTPRPRPLRGQDTVPRRVRTMRPVESSQWIEMPVPAIVSEELFDAVADQLRENAMRSRVQKSKARYLLQGLAVCRCCGYAMSGRRIHGRGKSKYEYYRCGGPAHCAGGSGPGNPPAARRCWNKPVRVDRLEEAVWSDVTALLNEPQRIQEEFQRRLQCEQEPQPAQKRAAETRARQVERSIQRLIDGYEEGLLEKTEFAPRVKAAREQLAKLKQEMQTQATLENQKAQMRLVIDNVNDFAEKVKSGLAQANWETRREIIRALVKQIEVDQDQVRIVYKVNPAPPDPNPPGRIWPDCSHRPDGATATEGSGRN